MAQPKSYTAPHAVYTGGKLYRAGEVFVTDAPRGDEWKSVSETDKAAFDAASPLSHPDATFDDLTLSELRAVAATKNIPTAGVSKKALLAALKAVDEPAL